MKNRDTCRSLRRDAIRPNSDEIGGHAGDAEGKSRRVRWSSGATTGNIDRGRDDPEVVRLVPLSGHDAIDKRGERREERRDRASDVRPGAGAGLAPGCRPIGAPRRPVGPCQDEKDHEDEDKLRRKEREALRQESDERAAEVSTLGRSRRGGGVLAQFRREGPRRVRYSTRPPEANRRRHGPVDLGDNYISRQSVELNARRDRGGWASPFTPKPSLAGVTGRSDAHRGNPSRLSSSTLCSTGPRAPRRALGGAPCRLPITGTGSGPDGSSLTVTDDAGGAMGLRSERGLRILSMRGHPAGLAPR